MATIEERVQIEDQTGIRPDQLRRLERMGLTVVRSPHAVAGFVEEYRASEARRPVYGCPSEAH